MAGSSFLWVLPLHKVCKCNEGISPTGLKKHFLIFKLGGWNWYKTEEKCVILSCATWASLVIYMLEASLFILVPNSKEGEMDGRYDINCICHLRKLDLLGPYICATEIGKNHSIDADIYNQHEFKRREGKMGSRFQCICVPFKCI
jgi:hypothetical protein